MEYNFTKGDVETELNVTCEEIFEGETAIITIASNKELTGICLIDIGDGKYYVELAKGRATTGISNLKAGKYDVLVKYLNGDGLNNSTALTVNEKLNPNMNVTIVQNNENATVYVDLENETTGNLSITVDGNPVSILNSTITDLSCGNHKIEVIFSGDKKYKPATYGETITVKPLDTKIVAVSSFTCIASDINASEKGGSITIGLTDVKGNPLSNKTLQVALNCKIYNLTTGENGQTILDVSMQNAKVYTCAITFAGDETYNVSPLTVTKLTVNKKKTTISASAKTFKVKTKSKISVTLKTVKNKYDGKTYLYKGKKLTLTVNGKTYTAKTNAKGVAKFSLKLAKKGKFTAKVKFAGDATYKASNKKIKITIK